MIFGMYLFISGQEIIFALLIALLLFGSKEIPKLARTFGKGMKEFRRATEDINPALLKSQRILRRSKGISPKTLRRSSGILPGRQMKSLKE
jgi:TatA/E family protein of Tat protein translocase